MTEVTEPVLVIAFNRPDHLRTLLDHLRQVQPRRVFFAVDGPREGRPEEAARVQACRDLAAAIDWPCSLETLFQEANLGCGLGVSTAISWFLGRVERGIILEDDIIPDPSFYVFCTELLDRYAEDERVLAISGCNFVPPQFQSRPEDPYRFSQIPHIWGWATWRRAWARHTLDIPDWRRRVGLARLWSRSGRSLAGALYWASTFELLARKEVDTWDGQLVLTAMEHGQLTATSNVNLVRNIGFDESATHTFEDRGDLQPVIPMALPTRSVTVEVDERADAYTRRTHFRASTVGFVLQTAGYLRRKWRRTS